MQLLGKSILISGAKRVGGELALELAARGAKVALTYRRSREAIDETVAHIEQSGAEAFAIQADLSRPEDAEAAVAKTIARFGRIDAFIAMASDYKRTPFDALEPADFDGMIASNLAAAYHPAVASAKAMLKQEPIEGLRGKILFVGDWATERPYKGYLPYLIAKGALRTLALGLASELAPWVHVNLLQPAMIAQPEGFSQEDAQAVLERTPVHRFGSPADLNNLILYLLEGTDFATGGVYRIDGGRFLGTDDDLR